MRKTKIVCTLGPACSDRDTIKAMVKAGMDVARLNFSHEDSEAHLKRIHLIREISSELNRPIAILQDLQGPKIRVGEMVDDVVLQTGDQIVITMEDVVGTATRFSSTYKGLARDVKEGDPLFINDGLIEIQVNHIDNNEIHGTVIHGGSLKSHKGINLSQSSVSTPTLTEKDIQDLKWGLAKGVDYVALSFVEEASDIKRLTDMIANRETNVHVIAKVERHEALDNLEGIVIASDIIMVARGDLGVEIPLEQVPGIQKHLIQICHKHLKLVITATQMLESMIHNPRPTRAEVSDIANAILDGTDALMLSGETAIGRYPVKAVETMARIADTVEASLPSLLNYIDGGADEYHVASAVGYAACQLAQHLKARVIICFTQNGFTAQVLSKYRQPIPIIAVTPKESVQRRLALYWGVQSLLLQEVASTDEMIAIVEQVAVAHKLVSAGDIIVIAAGLPLALKGITNLIKVHQVGQCSN
ncbi:pyruvate kinase [Aetokthonos hydrillicola Thurmond2011]|jgi:pyruvate kinase|uniref:Pyruvate kinase n=1 Tax=Aetokthonos hydrillicola Thurmond2011 TaxID=2712845 RepID=A0AAP5MA03_9CYAN|nr:pyruvate kinase [Aetokthonos hydrillicola]MBO3461579.1 pyruvate kinase [Aetokthonos hydrillicola CCALA 1050]MBW4586119.1 pyruvate kinase [Aetokthonos hydrillicola CCALA 1050]MDR9897725.1 pyruvate kinase [Aetokthonos hydrillicola Thurmond2011]